MSAQIYSFSKLWIHANPSVSHIQPDYLIFVIWSIYCWLLFVCSLFILSSNSVMFINFSFNSYYFSPRNKIQQAPRSTWHKSAEAYFCYEHSHNLGFLRHCWGLHLRNSHSSCVCYWFVLLLSMHQAYWITCFPRHCMKVRNFVCVKSWNSQLIFIIKLLYACLHNEYTHLLLPFK